MLRLARQNASNLFYHITEQSGVLQLVLQGWILGGENQYNYQREQLEFFINIKPFCLCSVRVKSTFPSYRVLPAARTLRCSRLISALLSFLSLNFTSDTGLLT